MAVRLCCGSSPFAVELQASLEREGFEVLGAADPRPRAFGSDVAVAALPGDPSVTDELLRALRSSGTRTVLVIAPRGVGEAAVLRAYHAGADQVLEAPVTPREVVARLRAVDRRSGRSRARPEGHEGAEPEIVVDLAAAVATVDGRTVALTEVEAAVLDDLIARRGAVVTRAELAMRIAVEPRSGALDAVVRRVRDKLEAVEGIRRIVTVRGVGFRLTTGA